MMTLARRDPFQELLPLRDVMHQLLKSSVVASNTFTATLPLDVYIDGDNYGIEVALPGLNPEAVNVAVLGNQVTISGEYPQRPEGRQYLFRERAAGRFERTVTLPAEIDADKVEAQWEHGVLRLIAPKAESARPKRISITAGQSAQPALSGKR